MRHYHKLITEILSKLIISQTFNFVISEKLYNSFNRNQKNNILKLFSDTILCNNYYYENIEFASKINLFIKM